MRWLKKFVKSLICNKMSARKMVNVNEEALKSIIATSDSQNINDRQEYLTADLITPVEVDAEVPVVTKTVLETDKEPDKTENHSPDAETVKTQKKRKSQKTDFSELFLKERTVKNKKQIYISVETYDVIRSYLKYIGDVSFIAYVDNILLQHIEEHKDNINELFDKKVKPF
jgi:hypothetical protein